MKIKSANAIYILGIALLLSWSIGCKSHNANSTSNVRTNGTIEGRFFVLAYNDLDFKRKSDYLIEVILLKEKDTIRKWISDDETFLFENIPNGQYRLIINLLSPVFFVNNRPNSNQWISPSFIIEKEIVTMISSYTTNPILGINSADWCFYKIDSTKKTELGTIDLDFDDHIGLTTDDTLHIYLSQKHGVSLMADSTFTISLNKRPQIRVNPGFYELRLDLINPNSKFHNHYSKIFLNIHVLPRTEFPIKIKELKKLDLEVPLFMTQPNTFFKLYTSCQKN